VAKIAPATTWPSTPIFQRPIRKLKTKPHAHRVKGIHTVRTWAILSQVPRDPIKMAFSAIQGGAPAAKRIIMVRKRTPNIRRAVSKKIRRKLEIQVTSEAILSLSRNRLPKFI
jgi:hypothetical protein